MPRRIDAVPVAQPLSPGRARLRSTFVFSGEADAVYLHHFMRGVAERPAASSGSTAPISGTCVLPIPKGPGFEYKFDVVRDGDGAWINDPLNPQVATDPFGANSVGRSYGYVTPAGRQPIPTTPAGQDRGS